MRVSGESAKEHNAIRLDSLATVNDGPLVEADDELGSVRWLDKTDTEKTLILGAHTIRIVRKK